MDDQDNDDQLFQQLQKIKNLQEGASQRCKRESLDTLKKLYKYSRKTSLTRKTIIEIESAIEKLKSQCDGNLSQTDDSCTEFYDLTNGTSKNATKKLRLKKRDTYGWRDQRSPRRSRDKSPKQMKFQRRLPNVISSIRSWTEYNERRERYARYSPSKSKDEDHAYRRQHRQRRSSSPSKYYRSHSRSPFEPPKYYDRKEENRASSKRYRRSCSNDGSDENTERRSRSKRRKSDRQRRSRSPEKRRKYYKLSKTRSPSRHRRVPIPKYFKEEDVQPQPSERSWDEHNGSTCSMEPETAPEDHLNESVIDELRKKIQSTLAHSSNRNKSPVRAAVDSTRHYELHGWQGEFDLDGESASGSPANQIDSKTDNAEVQQENISANLQDLQNDSHNLGLDVQRKKIQFSFSKSLKTNKPEVSGFFDKASTDSLTDARSKLSTLLKSALVDKSDNVESNKSHESPCESSFDTDSIDQEIIQKIVSQTQTSYKLPVNVPMDFESVKRSVATSKMLDDKLRSESQRYAGTSLINSNGTQMVRNNNSRLQVSHWAYSPTDTHSYTETPAANHTTTQVLRSSNSSFLTTRVNLPIPSTKFSPVSFQKPALPPYDTNQLKPNRLDTAFNSSAQIFQRRSTICVEKNDLPTTYGEYKNRIASRELLGEYKIPKKTITKNRFTAPVSNTQVARSDFQGYAPLANIIKSDCEDSDNYDRPMPPSKGSTNMQRKSDSTEKKKHKIPKKTITKNRSTVLVPNTQLVNSDLRPANIIEIEDSDDYDRPMPPSNGSTNMQRESDSTNPVTNVSKEGNAMTTLTEWMNTNQFATLVDLMQQLSQHKNLEKLKEALTNTNDCVTNEESGEGSNTAMSARNSSVTAITTTGEWGGNGNNRKKKPTTRSRSQPFNTTSKGSHETYDLQTVKSVPDKPTFKNIQLEWHSLRKILSCQVCDKPHGNSLVSHYINQHPNSEVLTSRLAPEAMECLRAGVDECKSVVVKYPSCKRSFQYKQFCYFCNVYKCFFRSSWITHLARHTGYYRYKCKDCSRLFANKPQSGRCAILKVLEEIAQPQFKKREILAYICDLCNFVRCHQHEIEMHLSEEHGEKDLTKFQETVFLRFPTVEGKYRREKKGSETVDDFLTNGTESETEDDTDSHSEYETFSDTTDDSLSQCDSDWTI